MYKFYSIIIRITGIIALLSLWFVVAIIFKLIIQIFSDYIFILTTAIFLISVFITIIIYKKIKRLESSEKIKRLDNVDRTLYPTVFSFKLCPATRSYLIQELNKPENKEITELENIELFFEKYENQLKGYDIKLKNMFNNYNFLNEVTQVVNSLDKENFPVLVKWRERNKQGLIEQILRDKENRPKDSVVMIAASYESDMT